MKKKFLIFLIFTSVGFNFSSSISYAKGIVAYGSSDAVYPAKNQEFFYIGFELGFKRYINRPQIEIIKKQLTDKKHLSALRAANYLLANEASVLTGFPTSHEAILVSKVAKEKNTTFISAAASHSALNEMGNYIFSIGESALETQKALLKFIRNSFGNSEGAVLIDKKNIFSSNQTKLIFETNQIAKNNLNLVKLPISDGILNSSALAQLKSGKIKYLVITAYADDSAKVLEQLIKEKIEIPVIGNCSWPIGNIGLIRRLLSEYKAPVFSVASVVKNSPTSLDFEKIYYNSFGRNPELDAYYGYDLGVIVAKTINNIEGEVNRLSFHKSFLQKKCFTGTTSGKVCFKASGGHVQRQIFWLKYEPKMGFQIKEDNSN